jgi:DNA topoisomerase-1
MKLIVVESPTKTKTLKKFLGKDYKVAATVGHLRDLPKKKLGVNIENNFTPKYVVSPKKRKVIKEIKKLQKEADEIYLAMDPDREGEAIAWHLAHILDLKNPQRIVFHEITESAIKEALKNPRPMDMQLVNAQQARRVLDRIVGYKLSPFLWKKVLRGLSAGRVQSVAVKLIADREKERKAFNPQEYWSISSILEKESTKIKADLNKKEGKRVKRKDIKTEKEAKEIVQNLKKANYKVKSIKRKERKKYPLPPFKTSTLQRTAYQKFRFTSKFTMGLAQALYEKGLITYHRSDSYNLSKEALNSAQEFINKEYGNKYWNKKRYYKNKSKGAQEAHEAIRPTDIKKSPETQKKLKKKEFQLYQLIWQRFIASQMTPAVFDGITIHFEAKSEKNYQLKSTGQTLKFNGFLKVYPKKFKEATLPDLTKGEKLDLLKVESEQHFTKPPARYTEASLIKALEKFGIGRPSTYATIMSTIQSRNYVERNKNKRFEITEVGEAVNKILTKHFPNIVDTDFTAEMEKDLDEVAEGKEEWKELIKEFYDPFAKNLEKKKKEVPYKKENYEETDKKCPECGAPLIIKLGRYGKFYACSAWPKCKYTKPLKEDGFKIKCPKCKKGDLTKKRTRRGKEFYGCSNWPKCDAASWYEPTGKLCPKCKSLLEKKRGYINCSNKDCKYKEFIDKKDKN